MHTRTHTPRGNLVPNQPNVRGSGLLKNPGEKPTGAGTACKLHISTYKSNLNYFFFFLTESNLSKGALTSSTILCLTKVDAKN